jgi:iron complex outermembrane recepter protein
MSQSFVRSFRRAAITGVALAAMAPALASAQDAPAGSEDDTPASEIVVTGTILRGTPPVGSNLISVGEERIAATGATTANELLASVPQVGNLFNTVPNALLNIAANQVQVVRPQLRNLGNATSSASTTLVLFDGHRIAPVGVSQNAIDPDIIPSIAIERVEVVTDGGSSTYGSDAVGGVINFITRKRFDGVKVQGHYGFADDYHHVDASAMVGKDWGSGSIFAAYSYQHNDAIFGRDRDYVRNVDWFTPDLTPRGRSCSPGNVQVTTADGNRLFQLNSSGVPSATPGSFNACDTTDDGTIIPVSTRHSALVGLHQDLADWLTVDLRAFYGERTAITFAPFRGQANVTSGYAYYRPVPGQSATAGQTVFFTLAPLLGASPARTVNKFQEWGANAEFSAKLTENWQLRTLLNYSRSNSEYRIPQLSQALLNSFGSNPSQADTINFYTPGAGVGDAANIARLINDANAGQGKQELFDARAILDGTLFSWAGGDIKVAVGYEHMHDSFRQRISTEGVPERVRTRPFSAYDRKTNSFFGEIQVPIIGADNRMGFIYALTLSGSVRHDRFSDFGNTTNPKVGVNFKPISWLGLRGNYSTSFNAPSLNDQLGSLRSTALALPFTAFTRAGDNPSASGTVALTGSNPGLTPQTARTYSFGIDIDPPFVEGLHASANYYNVRLKNIIGIPSPGPQIFALFPNNIQADVGGLPLATVQNFLNNSGALNAATALATVTAGCTNPAACLNVYEIVDFRQGNYGIVNIEGLDFAVNYRMDTGFGGIDAAVAGNYVLSRKSQTGVGAPKVNELGTTNTVFGGVPFTNGGATRLQLSTTIGADIGNFRAQATWNHTAGYPVVRCDQTTTPVCRPSTSGIATASGFLQDRIGAYDTINLFFKYDVPGDSMLMKDLSITLNVSNLLDTDPPISRDIGDRSVGYTNGSTLGRMIQVGLSKQF